MVNSRCLSLGKKANAADASYFGLDDWDDTESLPGFYNEGETTKSLTWRGDPSITFADWTVSVNTSDGQSENHHIHRSVMCYGTRSSRFFARVMAKTPQHKKTIHGGLPCTKVELDKRDAKNFPLLLDFIYDDSNIPHGNSGVTIATTNSTMTSPSILKSSSSSSEDAASLSAFCGGNLSQEIAVSLRHLAKVFEVDALMAAVNKFIQKDLNTENGLKYLVLANEYVDKRLLSSAKQLCIDNFTKLDIRSLSKLPLSIFRHLVQNFESFKDDNRELSLYLSEVVCRFMEKNCSLVTSELLLEMTDSLIMPYMASEAAIGFTAIVKALNPEDAKANWDRLVKFCRRCSQTVVHDYGWSDYVVDGALHEYLGHSVSARSEVNCVDSLLFATSFAAALSQAQSDYTDIASSQSVLEGLIASLYQTVDVLEMANERKDRYMESQNVAISESRRKVETLESEIQHLRQELERQKQLASQSQFSLRSHAPSTPQSNAKTPKARTTGRRYGTPPRSERHNNISTRPEIRLTASQSEDPAIRDLVSPSIVSSDFHARNAKKPMGVNSLEQMRSTSLA